MEEKVLTTYVRGIYCRQCPEWIVDDLLHTRGVLDAAVSFWRAELTVRYDPQIVTEAELRRVLADCGYKVLVLIAMVYVSALTVWGGVEEHFGAFISIAAFIQAPIIGMIVVDYLVVKKRKLSLKAAYFIEGHDAYRFTGGFNLVGIGCVILSCLITILFVYNPLTGSIQSPLFLIFTGSGFDAICGGLLYWLASLTPLKKYMLRDRDDLEIV